MSESKEDVGPSFNYRLILPFDLNYIDALKLLQQWHMRVYKTDPKCHDIFAILNKSEQDRLIANEIYLEVDYQFGPKETCYVP